MTLVQQLVITAIVSLSLIVAMIAIIIGPGRFVDALRDWRPRVVAALPYLVLMTIILSIRAVTQDYFQEISWLLDINLTGWIHAVEGGFITTIQHAAVPELSVFLGFMYLYGYVVLISFPAIAYFCLPSTDHLRELLAAYLINDTVGLSGYILFIAYGPRNLGDQFAEPILYSLHPDAAYVTGMVNISTNAFPSLHTSMAATALFLAWRTRRIYPIWSAIATIYGVSVIVATMYLGIHWAADVVAGLVLAAVAVYIGVVHVQGRPFVGRFTISTDS